MGTHASPPRTILLASDLTSRSDRARDRAWQLARDWRAALHVVHAIEAEPPVVPAGVDADAWRGRQDDAKREALRIVQRDVLAGELDARVHVEQGMPAAEAILAVAGRERCELVVLGEARERVAPTLGESTVEQVLRKAPTSVLLVRERPRGAYGHVLVGTDFTDEAQQALAVATQLFPAATITLMHASDLPYGSMLGAKPDTREHWDAEQLERLQRHVSAAAIPEERRAAIHVAVAAGPAGAALARYVREQGADLTVIGAHPRGALFDTFVGTTRRIVESVPGDLLMVRATRPD
ncbi:MAG TPA: universal stress protein [Xanthomonadales bacterium]|nr:universal stress protein [Xanthomonadales bacterium]